MWWEKLEEEKGQKDSDKGRKENCLLDDRQQRRLGKRGKDRRGPQENQGDGPKEILEVEKGIQEGRVRENANKKDLGLRYRSQEDVQTMEGKDLPFI